MLYPNVILVLASVTADPAVVLTIPTVTTEAPGAGRRVRQIRPEYRETDVSHTLFLPSDWSPEAVSAGRRWPVIVEYTGNYFPAAVSTGEVEDAALGYGLTAGRFIWLVLPFVNEAKSDNEVRWWGDVEATVAYANAEVPATCDRFGGDPDRVIICGFSRGAIAVNFIGLHDDEIAKLWAGFVTHDHYDGVREWRGTTWGTPLDKYRVQAKARLARLGGRPVLVCQSGSTAATRSYLFGPTPLDPFTFVDVNTQEILGSFPNAWAKHPHNDRWLMRPSKARDRVWQWVDQAAGSN